MPTQFMYLVDIEKSHVTAHFRKDPITGKLVWIHDYDDKRHASVLHAKFTKGDKVEIISGKHAGKIGIVGSYVSNHDRYNVNVPGEKALIGTTPSNIKAAVAKVAAPIPVVAAPAVVAPSKTKRAKAKPAATQPPVPAAGNTPAPAATLSSGSLSVGDKITVNNPKSNTHGKSGVLVFLYPNGTARIKVDMGNGKKEVRTTPAKNLQKTGGTVAPAAKAEAVKEAKAIQSGVNAAQNLGDPKEFLHEREKAYIVAPQEWKDLANATGILPIDEASARYISDNIHKLKTDAKGVVAKWAADCAASVRHDSCGAKNVFYAAMLKKIFGMGDGYIRTQHFADAVEMKIFEKPSDAWVKAGYDKAEVDEFKKSVNDAVESALPLREVEIALVIAKSILTQFSGGKSGNAGAGEAAEYNLTLDSKMSEIFSNEKFMQGVYYASTGGDTTFHKNMMLPAAKILNAISEAGKDGKLKNMTMRQVYEGVYSHNGDYLSFQKKITENFSNLSEHHAALDERYKKSPSTVGGAFSVTTGSFLVFDEVGATLGHNTTTSRYRSHWDNCIRYDSDEADTLFKEKMEPALKKFKGWEDQAVANRVLVNGLNRKTGSTVTQEPIMLPKAIFVGNVPEQVGYAIAKRKGMPEEVAKKILADYSKKRGKNEAGLAKAAFQKVSPEDEKWITEKILKSWDKQEHGRFAPIIHGIYQIGGLDQYSDFKNIEDKRDNAKWMFHGTHFAAATSITTGGGYRVSKGDVKAGRMLGDGVYFAPNSSKSAQYLGEKFSRSAGTRGVMFLNKVSLGSEHQGYGNLNRLTNFDSVSAKKGDRTNQGNRLRNDESCVRETKAAIPSFWIDMELGYPKGR